MRAGAHGDLLKDVTEQELLDTIRALRRGDSRLTPEIARKVIDDFGGSRMRPGHGAAQRRRQRQSPTES